MLMLSFGQYIVKPIVVSVVDFFSPSPSFHTQEWTCNIVCRSGLGLRVERRKKKHQRCVEEYGSIN